MKSGNIFRSKKSLDGYLSKLSKKKKIGLCHGCFDLIHPGHLLHFRQAKEYCDFLIISITSDEFLKKGLNRPVFSEETRMSFLSSIKEIDAVFLVRDPTGIPAIEAIKPNFYFKGIDYLEDKDLSGNFLREKKAVEKNGGSLEITTTPKLSSTNMLNDKFGKVIFQENEKYFNQLRKKISYNDVEEALDRFSNLEITVIGDIIIDEYVTCQPVGTNSKSPTISTVYKSSEQMLGGSICIARHISNFVKKVNLVGIKGESNWQVSWDKLFQSNLNNNINLKLIKQDVNTPHKTKFVGINYPSSAELKRIDKKENHTLEKLFSVAVLEEGQMKISPLERHEKSIKSLLKKSDSTISSDFGYSTLNPRFWKFLRANSKRLVSNVQTNSTNFGFNLANKYKSPDLLCIDELEARLIAKSPEDQINKVIGSIKKETKAKNILVTRGRDGLLYKQLTNRTLNSPALTFNVVDPIGAGDAVLSSATMSFAAGLDQHLLSFLGSVFGAISCESIGNRDSVTKEKLLNLTKSILT